MSYSDYWIGISHAYLTPLYYLGVVNPKGIYKPFQDQITLSNGMIRGIGQPSATWHWDFLKAAQRDILRAYCTGASNTIEIVTRVNDNDEFIEFYGIMVWPIGEDRDARRRIPFEIEFTNLIEYT